MNLDSLKKRLERIEATSFQKPIILKDGTPWTPKIPLLDMFVFLMECECGRMCGESPADLTPELQAEAMKWAEYESRPGEPPFHNMMGEMSRNLIESENQES